MTELAQKVEFRVLESELERSSLKQNLIKAHQPLF
jgi:excinuclease UvrABC nuclease subunit